LCYKIFLKLIVSFLRFAKVVKSTALIFILGIHKENDLARAMRDVTTIVGRDYSTIALTAKRVANALRVRLSHSARRVYSLGPYFPERGRKPTEQGRKRDPAVSRQARGASSGPTELVVEKLE